jgi:hypothetical protein
MPPAELLTCLRRRPFETFRIITSCDTLGWDLARFDSDAA